MLSGKKGSRVVVRRRPTTNRTVDDGHVESRFDAHDRITPCTRTLREEIMETVLV